MADGYIELSKEKLETPAGINELNRMLRQLYELISGDSKTTKIYYGYGSPEGVVVANVGSIYMRKDGGTATSMYIKESGTGATGWVAGRSSDADTLDTYHASTSAGANKIPVSDASGYLPDNTVDIGALKTTLGEVSRGTTGLLTLPGGSYGFGIQVKCADVTDNIYNYVVGSGYYNSNNYWTETITYDGPHVFVSFVGAGDTFYAQHRYVTSSGKNHWLFLLIDKITVGIIAAYSAPDHPAYGRGGDFNKIPHPFPDYDESKQEIVLVDQETIAELKAQVTEESTLLTLINNLYRPNMAKEEIYEPLHSGKFLGQSPELIEVIPDYIKVRKLIKFTPEELEERDRIRERLKLEAGLENLKREQDRISLMDKLIVLGLIKEEIDLLVEKNE